MEPCVSYSTRFVAEGTDDCDFTQKFVKIPTFSTLSGKPAVTFLREFIFRRTFVSGTISRIIDLTYFRNLKKKIEVFARDLSGRNYLQYLV